MQSLQLSFFHLHVRVVEGSAKPTCRLGSLRIYISDQSSPGRMWRLWAQPSEDEPSFFEKLRNRGSLLETKPVINQAFIPKTGPSARSVPIVTKNVSSDKHSDIKPFQGSWQYPRSDLLTYHPKGKPLTREEIELQSAIIERTLLQFGIEVSMAGFEV